MNFEWETEEERLLRYMKISPQAKMEWLYEMNELLAKTSSKQLQKIRLKLRELH